MSFSAGCSRSLVICEIEVSGPAWRMRQYSAILLRDCAKNIKRLSPKIIVAPTGNGASRPDMWAIQHIESRSIASTAGARERGSRMSEPGIFGQLNMIRGKNLVGACTKADVDVLFSYIDNLEEKLEDYDMDDFFGTEGWRHAFGLED